MFNLFKKPDNKPTTDPGAKLTERIEVDNLKSYVVKGYEKEKELKAELHSKNNEIATLKESIQEFEALKIVLDQREETIRTLQLESKKIELLEDRLESERNKSNSLLINNRQLVDQQQMLEEKIVRQTKEKIEADLVNRLSNHKGNLSKASAIEIVINGIGD